MSSTVPPPNPPKASPKGRKSDALLGSVVNGKYRILSLVAAGGMGKIYEAEQIALGRSVALKVLHTTELDAENNPQFKKRFFREASILARLQHPNVVTIFDYGAIEGAETERYFISMEYLSGQTLARRIVDRGRLPARDTIRIARQVARGLTEAHAHGIIHRDLKPSNVMLLAGRDGEELAKIVDFGIVKIVGDESDEKEDLTQEGSFIGSPKYMAPEQIARGGKIDARTDVYSFGIILYQCLTGTVPFDGASSIQTLMAHLNQPPQPIRERAPECDAPAWLEQLVMSCVEKEPAKRPQTMDAVAKTLAEAEAALSSSGILATMSMRGSGPLQAAGADSTLSSNVTGPVLRNPSTTTGTSASVPPPGGGAGGGESEKTRTSPGVQRDADATTKRGKKKTSPSLLLAIGVTVVLLGAVALRGLRHQNPAAVDGAPAASASHLTIRLESMPSGADVREGDRVLGTTPIELALDNDALRITPRSLTLVKEGFSPYPIVQGPSEESVRVIAQLAAVTAAAPATSATLVVAPTGSASAAHAGPAAGARRGPGRGGASGVATAGAASGHPDLDIRMNR